MEIAVVRYNYTDRASTKSLVYGARLFKIICLSNVSVNVGLQERD